MVLEMFAEAGVKERKRAAGVSQLFEAGVDEKLIQSHSGHKCLESLHMYERVNTSSRATCLQHSILK